MSNESDESDESGDSHEEYRAAFFEQVHNGRLIDWKFWIATLPRLKVREASLLMAGLDPFVYGDGLDTPPTENDSSEAIAFAERLTLLAERLGHDSKTPAEWLKWVKSTGHRPFSGFERAVQELAGNLPFEAPASGVLSVGVSTDWKEVARRRGREIVQEDKARDMYPSQLLIAEKIEREFRQQSVFGPSGKPLTAEYIKRHALQGHVAAGNDPLAKSGARGK